MTTLGRATKTPRRVPVADDDDELVALTLLAALRQFHG
jgi:hypothetical protein